MDSHEILKRAVAHLGPKYVADKLSMSVSLIYKWTQPQGELGSGSRNPLDRTKRLYEVTEDRSIIDWLCHQGGGFFIRNPKGTKSPEPRLYPAMNQVLQEFAEMLSVLAKAGEDNKITKKEAKAIRMKWELVKSASEGFVQACEEGQFGTLRENTEKEEE